MRSSQKDRLKNGWRQWTVQSGLEDLVKAQRVLDPLPADASITVGAVFDSEASLATDPAPYRPLERVHDALAGAERYRALVPALDDPRHVRLLYEHVVTEARPAELVVSPGLFETLETEFTRRMETMARQEGFQVLESEAVPRYLLAVVEGDGDAATTIALVVFGESGAVHGVLTNDSPDACRWATRQFERVADDARDRTRDLGSRRQSAT